MIEPNIGYIRIAEYTPLTAPKVRDAVESLKQKGATSLIVDERGNPGGLLTAVVATSDYFLSSGVIVSTRSRIPSDNEIFTAHPDTLVPNSFPIIILIDRNSASAAEIFAGALKDHNRALLVGETSFGKGSVQQVFFLPGGDGAFKMTTAKYYTPNGQNIDKIGIKPDIVVKEPELTTAEQADLKKLIDNNAIITFVRENPKADESVVGSFIAKLRGEGINLSDQILKRLIRNEQDRMQNDPPAYDLTYDTVLQEAVKLLKTGQYPSKGN
jgi:carboxyl-terminal processing protease